MLNVNGDKSLKLGRPESQYLSRGSRINFMTQYDAAKFNNPDITMGAQQFLEYG